MGALNPLKRFQSKSIRRAALFGGIVALAFIATHTYQSWQLNQKLDRMLSEQRYEEAISFLRASHHPYLNPEATQRLAWLLTTSPKLGLRNYPEAIELSTKIVDFSFSKETQQEALDTLACARFANREEKTAIEFAQKNGLKKRAEQFSVGRPCNDLPRLEQPIRTIASEKTK